ncbi:MAG: hypothetical protein JJ902_05295 [Roseibium sp.]|nr:hypothetical protein [Roseibium sp.]
MSDRDLLESFAARLGYPPHQTAKAAELLDLKARTVDRIRSGERPLTQTEKLAMSAILADLPAWDDSESAWATIEKLQAVKKLFAA